MSELSLYSLFLIDSLFFILSSLSFNLYYCMSTPFPFHVKLGVISNMGKTRSRLFDPLGVWGNLNNGLEIDIKMYLENIKIHSLSSFTQFTHSAHSAQLSRLIYSAHSLRSLAQLTHSAHSAQLTQLSRLKTKD